MELLLIELRLSNFIILLLYGSVPTIKGSKKLASGKVPSGLLKTVLEARKETRKRILYNSSKEKLQNYIKKCIDNN